MNRSRKLILKVEALGDLATDEMRRVVGGDPLTHLPTCDDTTCVGCTAIVTHGTSCEVACLPTDPINQCLTLDTCTPGTTA